jgi:cytochrome oxidase Cu insertion factor (SCO1/SenC/PrrC family)
MADHGMETSAPDPQTLARVETPAWFAAPLTEVHSGGSFTLDDFAGKVVLVETMAVWCTKCAAQQEQIAALHGLLGERDDFVSLSLDIDPYEDEALLKSFAENRGFDWMYAVAPEDVAREIGLLYGDQFLNPPSTPILIIDPQGEAHLLPFGIKSAEELLAALEPFLSEGA